MMLETSKFNFFFKLSSSIDKIVIIIQVHYICQRWLAVRQQDGR